ncbi:LGFP repeat protein [Aquisphaera giovannonii]|uniref:LGFP repeat protein n=1 Tax=Aquisphaera giovannonii TaxID=406548 RepID=A0A5B9W326_9BACT|nr:hypothetical protein [Aquisphaera giovannonii]QEH34998.1 LGFP repeat protein [Aquisphaera giovannonii]
MSKNSNLRVSASIRPNHRELRRGRKAVLGMEAMEPRQLLSGIDPIAAKYAALGGASSFLGKSTSAEIATSVPGGKYETFQGGAIYWSTSTGAHAVSKAVATEYAATAKETDASGKNLQRVLGLPTADEANVSGVSGGRMATFQGGVIYSSSGTGAHAVSESIAAKYKALGGPAGGLGLPTGEEVAIAGVSGGRMESFQHGTILWSGATGAHSVSTAIANEYLATAKETDASGKNLQTVLGLPTADEASVAGVSGARMATFQGGTIYYASGTGAHAVSESIAAKYKALGGPAGSLGLPTGEEVAIAGVSGGRMESFQHGTIYWSSSAGAHAIAGSIAAKFAALGGPSGSLGLPTADEANVSGVSGARSQAFKNGTVFWSATAGAHSVSTAIANEYLATAKETDASGKNLQRVLGLPTADEASVAGVSGARMATFQGGTIYYASGTGAHAVSESIAAKYKALGGPAGSLGLPTGEEVAVAGIGGGRMQNFQHGTILWSAATGAHSVTTAVANEYLATGNEGDVNGTNVKAILGLPTADEASIAGVTGADRATFQGGTIYWSNATGAHVVYGSIGVDYVAQGGPAGPLGLPTSDEVNIPGVAGGRMNTFQHGAAYYSNATGARAVYGSIGGEYLYQGGPTSGIGLPITDEVDVPGVAGARMNTFQGGTIYWSNATGAHVVYGVIRDEYLHQAGPASGIGLPITDEVDIPGVAGGRMNTFQRGTIYWSNATGAHVVYGVIRDEYLRQGGPASGIGLPTSDEMDVPGVAGARMNTFQHGVIYWSNATGAHVVYGAIGDRYAAMGGPAGVLGLPTSDEMNATGGRISHFQNGDLYWSPSTGVQETITIHGVPGGEAQTDDWSCGANSAARFLQYYGFDVTYPQVRGYIEHNTDLISLVHMGTRPSSLLDTLRLFRPSTRLESRVSVNYGDGGLDHVLDILATGRPVIALINPTGQSHDVGDFGPFTAGHLPNDLHWVVLTGYDRHDGTITYMDTTGSPVTESFGAFYQQWNWSAGGSVGDFLTGLLGVAERTILY